MSLDNSNYSPETEQKTLVLVRRQIGPGKFLYERAPYNVTKFEDSVLDETFVSTYPVPVDANGQYRPEVFTDLLIIDGDPYEGTQFRLA